MYSSRSHSFSRAASKQLSKVDFIRRWWLRDWILQIMQTTQYYIDDDYNDDDKSSVLFFFVHVIAMYFPSCNIIHYNTCKMLERASSCRIKWSCDSKEIGAGCSYIMLVELFFLTVATDGLGVHLAALIAWDFKWSSLCVPVTNHLLYTIICNVTGLTCFICIAREGALRWRERNAREYQYYRSPYKWQIFFRPIWIGPMVAREISRSYRYSVGCGLRCSEGLPLCPLYQSPPASLILID